MGRKLDDMSPEDLRRAIAAGGLRRDRREKAERLLANHEDGQAHKGQDRADEALRISRNANRIALAAVAVAVVALLVSYFDGS